MGIREDLTEYGLKLPDLIAGIMGGAVNALVLGKSGWLSVMSSVIVGAFTANYMGDPLSHYIGTSEGVAAFLTGLGGMALCQGLIAGITEAVKRWNAGQHPAGPTS